MASNQYTYELQRLPKGRATGVCMAVNDESINENIVKRASAGERAAQRELYEQFRDRTYRLVRRIVGDSDADDVTQDCFLKVFAKLQSFRFESQFSTWLHRLVVNEALQHVRSRSRRRENGHLMRDEDMGRVDGTATIENTELLEAALSRIEPELRIVFELKEVDELPYSQISEIVGIPEGTVGSRLNRARTELRDHLTQLGWES
ncbi:MAG: RNA polymerase sigma factor [Aureliella sp.]